VQSSVCQIVLSHMFHKSSFGSHLHGTTHHAHVSTYLPGNLKHTSYCGQIIQCLIQKIAQSVLIIFRHLCSSCMFRPVQGHNHGVIYRGADKSLARPTSRCILFDGQNISFDASLVLYIYIVLIFLQLC
jgi:hypothetical protein